MKKNSNFKILIFACFLLFFFNALAFAEVKYKEAITENLQKANRKMPNLAKKMYLENALQILYENTDSLKSLLKSTDTSDINFALNVYVKVSEINNTIFANSKPQDHLEIYEFEQETYHKKLHLLYRAYKITKDEKHAKAALITTEKYKSIELWKRDTLKSTFNVLSERDLEEIQEKMAAKQALISYHYGISNKKTDSCYAFVYTKDRISFQSIRVDTTLINSYVKELQNPFSEPSTYSEKAYKLYQDLFAVLPIDAANIKELTIFADGKLATIPFEALLTKNDNQQDFLQMPFLLKKYDIHYDLSLPLWNEQKVWTAKPNLIDSFLIVSPSFSKSQLNQLPANAALAQNLYSSYEDTYFLQKNKASISQFQSYAPHANIIHLASHAFLSSESIREPYIAFSDGYFRASQLSDAKLSNCHLAVLACCNTGNGNYQKGIGIKSLNYSFRKNGVKSVIASLWSVNDQTTKVLLENFYHFLASGDDKSKALQKAKIEYLNTPTEYNTPYYWAGLILNGQKDAVVLKTNKCSKQQNVYIYYLLIILFLVLLLLLGSKLRTKTKH